MRGRLTADRERTLDWDSLLPIILGLLAVIGLPLALWSLRKTGGSKVEEFCQHLQQIGVKAVVLPPENPQSAAERKRSWGQRPVATIKVDGRNMESVNVVGVASQYGSNFYVDCVVTVPSSVGSKRKKTKLTLKRSSPIGGAVAGVVWKGDERLAQRLNYDFGLNSRLVEADAGSMKGGLTIYPEPKRGRARIRMGYFLPTAEQFEAVDMVARHVRQWY